MQTRPYLLGLLALLALPAALDAQDLAPDHAAPSALQRPDSPGLFVLVKPNPNHARLLVRLGQERSALAEADASDAPARRAAFEATVAELRQGAEASARQVRELARELGADADASIWLGPGFAVNSTDPKVRARLAAHPDVLAVEPITYKLPQIATAMDAAHHNVNTVHTTVVNGQPLTGHGVEIAVLDSGMDLDMGGTGRPHRAFFANGDPNNMSGGGIGGSRILDSWNVSLPFLPVGEPEDIHGHGTRVTSAIAAYKWSNGFDVASSMAHGSLLHNFKISNDDFIGAPASTVTMGAALTDAAQNPNIRVANLSYDGDPAAGTSLNIIIDNATNAGLFITLSAGNEGADLTFAHGAYNSMTVGGSYEFAPSPYVTSAIGPINSGPGITRRYPDMLAVGDQVSTASINNENVHIIATGTSIASGFVAGAGALLIQAVPELTPPAVKALLLDTTAGTTGNKQASGLGYMRVGEAVDMALAGDVVMGTLDGTADVAYPLLLQGGQPVRYTLCWNRVVGGQQGGVLDLGLELRDSSGQVVATADSAFNVEEKLVYTPPSAGNYTLVIKTPELSTSTVSVPYGLAGPGLNCPANEVSVQSLSPFEIPVVIAQNEINLVTLKGNQLDQVTDVSIAGHSVAFNPIDAHTLLFTVPLLPIFGNTPVVLTHAGGFETTSFLAVANGINLQGPEFHSVLAPVTITVSSKPGDVHFLLVSKSLSPSELPGYFDLAIGNNFTQLTQIATIAMPSFSPYQQLQFNGLPGAFVGTFHAQTIVFDPSLPVLPLATSPVLTTLIF